MVVGCVYMTQSNQNNPIEYDIRKAAFSDKENLKTLYQRVAAVPGGLARTHHEITGEYIQELLDNGIRRGLMLVVEYEGKLIGAMTKYKVEPQAFAHVLTGGSILVDPDFQSRGIGNHLISLFLFEIEDHHPDILRVEILVRESNPAIRLYKRLGFIQEGAFEKRTRAKDGGLEADIPFVWFNPNYNHVNCIKSGGEHE